MPDDAVVRAADAAAKYELQDGRRFAATPADAKAALLATALEVVTAEPEELAAEKPPEPPRTAAQHIHAAAMEAGAKEPPAAPEGDPEAGREVLEDAMRFVTRGRDRAELERQRMDSYYERNLGEVQRPDAEPASASPKNTKEHWKELAESLSPEERGALIDAAFEADAETEIPPVPYSEQEYLLHEHGVEEPVLDDDEDEWNNDELDSLPAWAPGGSDYEGDETE